jgi:hypothetical protein
MSFAYHGNWCGPGWSDGRRVQSTTGFAPSIDEFDETCRQHDFALSGGRGDLDADLEFARLNFGRGEKRTLAAVAVLSRALVDQMFADNKHQPPKSLGTMTKPALRGTASKQKNASNNNRQVAAPVAIGSVMRAVKTQHIQTKNGAILRGSDFLSTVEGNGVTTFGVGKSALLSPAYMLSTFLGNMARSFEKYRWKRLRVHYVPKVATTANGQIVMCSSHSVSEPCLQGESGTFLQRAMSQGNAAMGPLWMENFIDIECSQQWYMVDPATTSDPDDAIAEELQVYTQTSVSGQVGYLYIEYEVEFSQLTYQPHASNIPIPTGPGVRATLADVSAVNAINDDWLLNDPTGTLNLGSISNGSIFRAVFDLQGSAIFTGGTFGSGIGTVLYSHTTTAAITAVVSPLPLAGGLTLYLVVNGSALSVYSTFEGAISGVGSGQTAFRLASTAVGSYSFDCALVRYGNATLPTVQ